MTLTSEGPRRHFNLLFGRFIAILCLYFCILCIRSSFFLLLGLFSIFFFAFLFAGKSRCGSALEV